MKTIGLIGGMSWESTVSYYRLFNETIKAKLGGLHSAQIVLYSADFHEIEHLQRTVERELAAGYRRVGLLDTRFTMEQAFYRERLVHTRDLEVLVPNDDDRGIVHRVIYDELCCGRVADTSRIQYRRIIDTLVAQGAEAVILGCTEISMLESAVNSSVPLFDTTAIHARAAAEHALH